MSPATETLSPLAQQFETRATAIAEHLTVTQLATQAEIDECYSESDDPEVKVGLAYAALRVLLFDRAPDKKNRQEKRKSADRVILDALRGASKAVTLSEPIGDLREVSVHPKSLNALIELAERDAVIGFFNDAITALRETIAEDPTADRVDHLARAVREMAYQQRVCVWIVTHVGPGLPYSEHITNPELPVWLNDLSPIDALMIFRAHEEVNAGRLAALQALPRGRKDGDDTERGWGVYLANLASLLNRTAEQLSRDQSLAALFAQSYVHSVDQERAAEEAKGGRSS